MKAQRYITLIATGLLVLLTASLTTAAPKANPERDCFFGDTHAHSSLSSDAFGFGNNLPPDNAYKLARGDEAKLVNGKTTRLTVPLDFFMMTDHAEMVGIAPMALDPKNPVSKGPLGAALKDPDKMKAGAKFLYALQTAAGTGKYPEGYTSGSIKNVWRDIVATADKYYKPGTFTTFAAFEWTSMPDGENLHRNVIFRDTQKVPDLPFSAMDSVKPEDLWSYLEAERAKGNDNFAISHNGNMSNGRMFAPVDSYGAPITAEYAKRRMENEPLFEIQQLKGTSETVPAFAPEDEFADFELLPFSLHTWQVTEQQKSSFAREAYKSGLRFQQTIGANPFKFGLEGGGDDHGSAHTWEEFNYHGGHALMDANPKDRMTKTFPLPGAPPNILAKLTAGGITGLWAESNTRDAIFDALRRKETFGSSGVRIKPRFFASFDFPADLLKQKDWVKTAYAKGVPMGGDLMGDPKSMPLARTPMFVVHAVRDPNSAPLQRIQIIKGWTKNGEMFEKIYDVACADGGKPDPKTHRWAGNGAKVDMKSLKPDETKGDAELSAVWTDPEFDKTVPAFYYMRVIENPVARWSTHDAKALGMKPLDVVPATIQERVWTSPIWYTPVGEKSAGPKFQAIIVPYGQMTQ
jgi:hypothetical protein